MKRFIRGAFRACGLDLVRYNPDAGRVQLPADVSDADGRIIERVSAYTMTGLERQIALIGAVRHLARHRVEGCFVECGVWRGGSSMAVAMTLVEEGDTTREVYLFDTFEGMPPPGEVDRTIDGTLARTHMERDPEKKCWVWAVAGLNEVKRNMTLTGYPPERVHYVEGPVEVTLPSRAPGAPIALLRLDTDWYESTKHELVHLFPRLCDGGILIIDDYGHWQGARKAVDEYLATIDRPCYLHRIDYAGRLLVKCGRDYCDRD